ncbi:hypothetical protein [Lewinella sp. IMCC34191]|uniref:hypothetical protein n=1 Tax=Lewinella sp. IMCC34191 TaxID=2259172 RepID=UPI000E2620AE|nr:hypothetical protein [Lewinella sp. IMCC34191]
MRSFYSVIYVQTNAAAQDRLAIAMVMMEPEAQVVRYDYSARKLKVIGELVQPGVRTGIKWTLSNLKSLFSDRRVAGDTGLFDQIEEASAQRWLSERYLNQLATYQKNLIQFSKPVGIELQCTEQTFEFLYKEQIDDIPDNDRTRDDRRLLLEIKDRPIIKQRFDQNVRVDQTINPRVEIPVKVSLFGRNGVDYFGKVIDPYRPVNWLNQDASSFLSLALQTPKDVHYLISKEPDPRTHPKQHDSWKQYRKVPSFEYIDVSEIEKIERVAERKDVHRVLGEEE